MFGNDKKYYNQDKNRRLDSVNSNQPSASENALDSLSNGQLTLCGIDIKSNLTLYSIIRLSLTQLMITNSWFHISFGALSMHSMKIMIFVTERVLHIHFDDVCLSCVTSITIKWEIFHLEALYNKRLAVRPILNVRFVFHVK